MDESIRIASKLSFATIIHNTSFARLFRFHSNAILRAKVLRDRDSDSVVIAFIQRIVNYLPKSRNLTSAQKEKQHARYITNICDAMQALDYKSFVVCLTVERFEEPLALWTEQRLVPALAAATGHAGAVKPSAIVAKLQQPNCPLFPDVLAAAVAAGQDGSLQIVLQVLLENVKKGSRIKGSWEEMRKVSRSIGEALKVAIRMHKNTAAAMIFNFFAKNTAFKRSTLLHMGDQLTETSLVHENRHTIVQSLKFDLSKEDKSAEEMSGPVPPSCATAIRVLFKKSSKKMLRYLIELGQIDPKSFTRHQEPGRYISSSEEDILDITPLKLALLSRRLDLARVLINHGAVVDTPLPASNHTCLHEAVENGHIEDTRFLLQMGADPGQRDDKSSAWALAAMKKKTMSARGKCLFLFEELAKEGKEGLKRGDLWEDRYPEWCGCSNPFEWSG